MHINTLTFVVYPYLCVFVFLCGVIYHLQSGGPRWEGPSEMERGPASNVMQKRMKAVLLFHLALLPIIVGHVLGLFVSASLMARVGISLSLKQAFASYIGGLAGLAALCAGLLLLGRRLFDLHVRADSRTTDTAALIFVLLVLMTGLATAVHSVRGVDGALMETMMHWAQALVSFRVSAASELIAEAPLIIKVHILAGFTLLCAIPLTPLSHAIWSPVRHLDMALNREKYAALMREYQDESGRR